MDIVETEAQLVAATLPVNGSLRTNCPICTRKTFSVTRMENSVYYNCYRASCPTAGHIGVGALTAPAPMKSAKLKPYTKPLYRLEDLDHVYFRGRFELEPEDLTDVRVTEDDRYAFDIITPLGYSRGKLVRDPSWKGFPRSPRKGTGGAKAVTYRESDGPIQSWYNEHTTELVLVEDILSAKCTQKAGIASVALLGTHLNNEKVREIIEWNPSEVIIALDADATEQAFKLARKWGLAFRKTRVCVLAQDLKDTPVGDIPYVLGI